MRRAIAIWRASLDEERRLPRVDRNREEREFLPAALEVLETPASPAGRSAAALICSLFCVAVAWSWFGHVDTVAVAQGRIVPGGRVKLIQPLEVGVVREIHVREGQRVHAGDPLVDLDPTESEVDVDQTHERSLRELFEKRLGARGPWFESRRELAARERELVGYRHRIRQLDSEIAATARRREEIVAEFLRHAAASRVEALAKMEQSRLELRSALLRAERNRLRAPVNGTVHRLSVHTVGGVVRTAEPLMAIVPEGVALEVEADVLNRDVGFVEVGQPVEVKVEAFPFTRYGLIEGEVAHLSADAVVDDASGPVYPMKVKLAEERIRVGDRWVGLSPGMTVAAEIRTGKRRAIEFFLAPLLRYRSEALRER